MNKLEEQKKRLQQKMNLLKEKEAKVKIAERKQRTRKLIELGGLIEKAELSDLTVTQLLGSLLQIKKEAQDGNKLRIWEKSGEQEFNKNKGSLENEKAITIKFKEEPAQEIRKKLRSFSMRWNSVRKEWEGVTDVHIIQKELSGTEIILQEIEAH